MKITERKWERASRKKKIGAYDLSSSYVRQVLKELTRKEVFIISGDVRPRLVKDDTEEGRVFISNYILGEFCEKYNLKPGLNLISTYKSKAKKESKSDILYQDASIIAEKENGPITILPCMLFGRNIVVTLDVTDYVEIDSILYTSDKVDVVSDMVNSIRSIYSEAPKDSCIKCKYYDVYKNSRGNLTRMGISDKLEEGFYTNINEHYNDDIPKDNILEFLYDSKDSGIIIFHGIPGTGKSTFIKYLIYSNPELEFNYVSQDLINDRDAFKNFVISLGENQIFIVEDCERLLMSRTSMGGNSALSEILNLSDGYLGDKTKTKFIATFNTKLNNIDEAVLRKGRLKVKYEFKELCGEKLEELAKSLGISLTEEDRRNGLTLADIFNYGKEGYDNIIPKIGFTR